MIFYSIRNRYSTVGKAAYQPILYSKHTKAAKRIDGSFSFIKDYNINGTITFCYALRKEQIDALNKASQNVYDLI